MQEVLSSCLVVLMFSDDTNMRISEFEWFVFNALAQEVATEVFQFLQAVKEWYFGEIWTSKVGKGWAV